MAKETLGGGYQTFSRLVIVILYIHIHTQAQLVRLSSERRGRRRDWPMSGLDDAE